MFRAIAAALIAASTCACTYVPTTSFAYQPTAVDATPRLKPKLVVMHLSEARPPRSYPTVQTSMFKTYIPLLPYVRIPYERLDETSILHEQRREQNDRSLGRTTQPFTAAIAEAIATDLRASGLFSEVTVAGATSPVTGDAYVLEGDLQSSEFDILASSYMLGPVGVLLWLLPIPCGGNAATVDADLRLRDPQGEVVWQDELSARRRRIFTLYNSFGAPISSRFKLEVKRYGSNDEGIDGDSLWAYHASATRSGMDEVKRSLAAFLSGARETSVAP
jgi:hypothetical protein